MAKRKRSRRSMTIPLAPILGLAAGFSQPLKYAMEGNYSTALDWAAMNFTGYLPSNNTWQADRLMHGLFPLVVGVMVHKYVGGRPFNLNRTLAAAGVPYIRL